ncbi:MAG: dephospho-CoA kinase [Muribaculaceae bacterium]|nr:dephospho-CoA kinase [Muribaculaceae bacterium]
MKLIAITGGIGSGKSVVSRMLQVMGYEVYDCDSRAKRLMNEDALVRDQIVSAFGTESYCADGSLNKSYLGSVAFTDEQSLSRLNAIVHPATARDIAQWAEQQAASGVDAAFVETALLRTARLDRLVDQVWHVTAPALVRIDRVRVRSGLTAQQVRDRMAAQSLEEALAPGECAIVNDDKSAVMPQVADLLAKLK